MVSNDAQASTSGAPTNGHITEDEASLYDRQIRLWGLEAQNRMRSSTVLVLSLRGLAHETIKNLVLAGIGRLIVMDGGVVTEDDLGCGFLFREEDGAVGKERTAAALPQIESLNPLVSLTALPTLEPFVSANQEQDKMVEFLERERVNIVVACDLPRSNLDTIDAAARRAGSMFYAATTYGFYGYVLADLGDQYDFVYTPPAQNNVQSALVKKSASYTPISSAFDRSNWSLPATETSKGGSPFRGLTRAGTREVAPADTIGIMALWEYEKRHSLLPSGVEGQEAELKYIAEELRTALGVHQKAVPSIDDGLIGHLAAHATHMFPPTLAIVGGLLAQDVLRAMSRKEIPVLNLLTVNTIGGVGGVSRWGVGPIADAKE